MNPQNNHAQNQAQNTDLSVPVPGQGSMPAPVQSATQQAGQLPQSPQSPVVDTHITANQRIKQGTAGTGALSSHAPQIADDVDLIEKEWVNKAKSIVAKTKDDPREQSK
jgi:hypothetical protein